MSNYKKNTKKTVPKTCPDNGLFWTKLEIKIDRYGKNMSDNELIDRLWLDVLRYERELKDLNTGDK